MLKVREIVPDIPATLEWDFYIPFTASWPVAVNTPVYWMLGDDARYLLEIKIAPDTGLLYEAILIDAPDFSLHDSHPPSAPILAFGLPKFDTGIWRKEADGSINWSEGCLKKKGAFIVNLWSHELEVQLSNYAGENTKYVQSGRILLGLTPDQELCSIRIINMTAPEHNQIRESLEAKKSGN